MKLIELARTTAERLHEGQTDKAGKPYIEHPITVALVVAHWTSDPEVIAAALLHDTLEDCDITAEGLHDLGFSDRTVELVTLLTRTDDVSKDDYYTAIANDPDAMRIKKADIAHNTSAARLNHLDKKTRERLWKKYTYALGFFEPYRAPEVQIPMLHEELRYPFKENNEGS